AQRLAAIWATISRCKRLWRCLLSERESLVLDSIIPRSKLLVRGEAVAINKAVSQGLKHIARVVNSFRFIGRHEPLRNQFMLSPRKLFLCLLHQRCDTNRVFFKNRGQIGLLPVQFIRQAKIRKLIKSRAEQAPRIVELYAAMPTTRLCSESQTGDNSAP